MVQIAWTTPATYTDGSVLTAAMLNLIRDNLNETAPAKITANSQWLISTGANSLVARDLKVGTVPAQQATTSTAYVDLTTAGPVVTVNSGTRAMVFMTTQGWNAVAGDMAIMAYALSGATVLAASTISRLLIESSQVNDTMRVTVLDFKHDLTPGSNTFTAKYKSAFGGQATFSDRELTVMAL